MTSRKNASQRVYDRIREMAIDYEFRPDENINESALAIHLGVSRTPIRDALNRLLNEGLMNFQTNRGFFCRSLSAEELFDLAEVRLGLEQLALQLAAERASYADRLALLQFWRDVELRMPRSSTREVARFDEEFHERIFLLSGNAVLISTIRQINARIRFVRQIEVDTPIRKGADFDEHIRIAEALVEGNITFAIERLVHHLTFTREDSIKVLREGLLRIFIQKPAIEAAR